MYPGDGYYAHEDGYNVLFGDWHVEWFSDTAQELMWFDYDPEWGQDERYADGNHILRLEKWGNGHSFGQGWFHNFDRLVDPNIVWWDGFHIRNSTGWDWNN